MKASLKTKILFFSFIFLFFGTGIFSIISLTNAQTSDKTNLSANIITVTPASFYSFLNGKTYNFIDDRLGYYDVLPGNPALTSFTPLNPFFINNDTVIYPADAVFSIDVGYSTSFSIDKIYNCNPTYVTQTWLTLYTYPNWLARDEGNYVKNVYTFTYSQYPLQRTSNQIDFDGITNFQVAFASSEAQYQGKTIGYIESNLNQIYSNNYITNSDVGNYTNINSNLFTKDSVKATYDTTKTSLTDVGGDGTASFNTWMLGENPGITVENNTIPVTVQNEYQFPLPSASYVQIKNNQANSAQFSIPTQIRPAISYDYRDIILANGTCWLDTSSTAGTSGVDYGSSSVTDSLIQQRTDATVQNVGFTQRYIFSVRITSKVQLSALENAGINLQTSGFMQSNWFWDNSVFQGGGSVGTSGFQLSPWWLMLIPVVAIILVVIFIGPQIEGGFTGYLLGKAKRKR